MVTTTMRTILALGALLLFSPASGQNSEDSRASLQGIKGVSIFVDSMSVELDNAGVHPFVVAVEVERILKEHAIPVLHDGAPAVPGSPTLYVEVIAALQEGPEIVAYSIRLEFMQTVVLERMLDAESRLVTTWSTGGTVLYGKGWRKSLLEDVVSYTEEFAEAYWEQNPE